MEFIPAAARRYGEAAFELALERGELDRWADDLRALAQVLAEPGAVAFFESARVPEAEKERVLEQVLEGIGPLAWNLVRLLVSRGRLGLTPQIALAFQELVDEHRGVAHAVVSTAVPLTAPQVEAVAARLGDLTGKQVVVEAQEEPGIIGGLVARIGDRLIDGSTRGKLESLKRELEGTVR